MNGKSLKELGLLGLLLVVLGGVLYVNYFRTTDSPTVSARRSSEQAANVPPQAEEKLVPDVKLDWLGAASEAYSPAKRDLFRFPPKPEPVVRAPAVPDTQVKRPPQTPIDSRPQVQSLVRYIGYAVSASGAAVATVSVRSNSNSVALPFVGVAGDVIEGRYRLQRIEPSAIEVVELGADGRRTRIPKS